MNINVQTINFSPDEDFSSLIDKKLQKFEKFKEHIVNGQMYLRKESEAKVENKTVEVKINVKGKTLFAKNEDKSFERALDQSVEAALRQLRKYKEKMQHQ